MTRIIDYKKVFETIVSTLSDYITNAHLKTMCIGLSGGLDSTVSAAICCEASNRTGIPLIGVSLPCSTNKQDEIDGAQLAGNEFCTDFKVINIQDSFKCVELLCTEGTGKESTPISQGNIKARLRMIVLYDFASKNNGIVIDNDMLTENLLSFFTINGDVFDISPLSMLWKTEVYGLAKWLLENVYKDSKALKSAIEIVPTDGNGVSGSDIDQIMPGYTYYDVDKILQLWVDFNDGEKEQFIKNDRLSGDSSHALLLNGLISEYGLDNVKRVIMRSVKSEFKRYPHPISVDCFNGGIIKK